MKRIWICSILVMICASFSAPVFAYQTTACDASLSYLQTQYDNTSTNLKTHFGLALANMTTPPEVYGFSNNPWLAVSTDALLKEMLSFFRTWCGFLPEIEGDNDNALYYIQYMAWFSYKNDSGLELVRGTGISGSVFPTFLQSFITQRGAHMDSSVSTAFVDQWVTDARIEIEDYQIQSSSGFNSWNEFFARKITQDTSGNIPSRPITMPTRNYVITAPTDCIMNSVFQNLESNSSVTSSFIENPLRLNTVMNVKNVPISLDNLLGNASSDLKAHFVNGTAMACVLMPNTYHRFNSVVTGTVLHAEVVTTDTSGTTTPGVFAWEDFANFVPANGDVGGAGTNYKTYETFQRGVVITDVTFDDSEGNPTQTGYVAQIPVGLSTIGSVILNTDDVYPGAIVTRGATEVGNFFYGGSLYIIVFSEGLTSTGDDGRGGAPVRVRLGNQIALLDTGDAPPITGIFDAATDIGNSGGSVALSDPVEGRYTLTSPGILTTTSDRFEYLNASMLASDGIEFSAQVWQTVAAGKGGLMIRDSVDAGAMYVAAEVNNVGQLTILNRDSTNAQSSWTHYTASYPYWIKMVYVPPKTIPGHVEVSSSTDGSTWTLVATRFITFSNENSNILAGFAIDDSSGTSRTKEFTDVSLNGVTQ